MGLTFDLTLLLFYCADVSPVIVRFISVFSGQHLHNKYVHYNTL